MKSRQGRIVLGAAVAAAALAASATVRADVLISSFTPGDLVVLRGGDSTNSDLSGGNAYNGEVSAYLDEYTTGGTYVGTMAVGSGLTLPGYGADSHEGVLNLSTNGQLLAFGGYTTAAGATAHATDGSETEVIGTIGSSASSLDTSTDITPAEGTGQFIRGVATNDGSSFYVAGKNPSGSTAGNGLKYVVGTGASASVTTLEGTVDWRNVILANNTLYGGTGSSSVGVHGAYQIGDAGAPPISATPTNTLLTNYSGGQSASNLALLDVPTSDSTAKTQNGFDVLYTIGDQSTSGITKYYFDGTTWQTANLQVSLNATNIENPTGLIATIDPTNPDWVDIYVSGQNGIYSYVDKSGDPTTGIANNAFSILATPNSADNAAFYGMAFAPTAAVPEPATLGLIGLAALPLLRRRRA